MSNKYKPGNSLNILVLMIFALVLTFSFNFQSYAQGTIFDGDALEPDSRYSNPKFSDPLLPGTVNGLVLDKVEALETVSIIVTYNDAFNVRNLETVGESEVVHKYQIINGASMILAGDKVEEIIALPGITGVYLDEMQQIETDNSPAFIGAPAAWNALGGQSSAGEGTLFASIDSGVWPEHPSFSDPDPAGNNYPAADGGPYPCEFGNTGWNPDDAPFSCNNKLVGAYAFLDTYKAVIGLTSTEFDSARDDDGHGTHTASTAAGNGRVSAAIAGSNLGLVSGIAPRAQVITYKVCGAQGCFNSDAMAAIEQAIIDGVDVINYSISGGSRPYSDIVSLAFLRAYDNGIFVAKSAGNSGPDPDTVAGRSPWVTTVAASTQDRNFTGRLTLTGDNGDILELDGVSLTGSHTGEVVLAADFDSIPTGDPDDGQCLTPFPSGTWAAGEIVVCERGTIARVTKGYNVLQGGAGGYVLYNPTPNTLVPDNHFLPAIHIQNTEGMALLTFLADAAHVPVTGDIVGGIRTASAGNMMATFSSRGGAGQTLGVSKPDITAPGVQILAGHTPLPGSISGGAPGELFQVIQGTSMSAPHVAGSALLLKALHPDWTAGQIKSALMTTAYTDGLVKEDGVTPVDHFDAGSGHIDLTRAIDPGLTISAAAEEFITLKDSLWMSNYPSLYIPVMPGEMRITRIVHSELAVNSRWRVRVETPEDVRIRTRGLIWIRPHRDRIIDLRIDASRVPHGEVRNATLILDQIRGPREVVFPITIVRDQPDVVMENECSPAVFGRLERVNCTIAITNNSFDNANIVLENKMPRGLRLISGSVDGANEGSTRFFSMEDNLFGAEPAIVQVADGTGRTPGYLPLASLGVDPVAGMGDESIVNFTLPPIEFAGETFTTVGMVSNGYLIMGGGTNEDVSFVNQVFPDPTVPNNVLAPFWTDLNPSAGGNLYAGILTDPGSGNSWVVFEWADVQNFSDGEGNSFQVWIGVNGVEDMTFVYGDVSDGDGGLLTVGAENSFGSSGENWYANGDGTPVTAGVEVAVTSIPGAPGESHTVSFTLTGWRVGPFSNCAELTSDLFTGTSVVCFNGEIIR